MLRFLCCRSHSHTPPNSSNSGHKESRRKKSHSLIQRSFPPDSTGTLETSKSEGAQEMRRIFRSVSRNNTEQGLDHLSGHDDVHMESGEQRTYHVRSPSRLQEVLRKRLSRDSVFSWKSSSKKSKTKLSEEDINRRRELKRAMHQRLQVELLNDQGGSQGGYDTDAEIIVTPTMSKSRSGGNIRITPKELSDLVRQLETSHLKNKVPDEKFHEDYKVDQAINHKPQRLYYETVSGTTSIWEDDVPEPGDDLQATLNEIRDSLGPIQNRYSRTLRSVSRTANVSPNSDLHRSDTVIRVLKAEERHLAAHEDGDIGSPASPDLRPLRLPSIPDSVRVDWHLSAEANHRDSGFATATSSKERLAVPGPDNTPKAKGWSHGASGLLNSSVFSREPEDDYSHLVHASNTTHGPSCDPVVEEHGFGGVDGEYGDHHELARIRQGSMSHKTMALSIDDGHLKVPMSPSRSLVPTVSMPLLSGNSRHTRSRSSWDSVTSDAPRNRGKRRSGSSEYMRSSLLIARGPLPDNASSVYTSQVTSRASSPGVSRMGAADLIERVEYLRTSDLRVPPSHKWRSSSDIVSLAGSPLELLESDLSRRCTMESASWQSSTDSFRAQELAAAEKRFVPKARAFSAPKVSRFKEELSRPSETSLAKRTKGPNGSTRHSRRTSKSHDSDDGWHLAGKRQGYGYSFVPKESESASDLWERALQDHAREVAEISGPSHNKNKSHGSKGKRARSSVLGNRSRSVLALNQTSKAIKHNISDAASMRLQQGVRSPPAKSSPSWSKFPSHKRADRSLESAGESDHVITHDFVLGPGIVNQPARLQDQKLKSRSMTFSKRIFKPWGRLYKSQSSNLERAYRGYRTSVSVAGQLAQPELEILAPMSPPMPTAAHHGPIEFKHPRFDGDSSCDSDESAAQFHERSAKAWSKLYEDCLPLPQESDTEEPSIKDQAIPKPAQQSVADQSNTAAFREPSSASAAEIRASTLDFQRSLLEYEAQSLEKALQAAQSV